VHAYSSSKKNSHGILAAASFAPDGEMTAAGQVIRAIFEDVHPGRGNSCKDCPRGQDKELSPGDETQSNRRQENSGGLPWFERGPLGMPFEKQVQSMVLVAIFTSKIIADRQQSTLGSASLITFACSGSAPTGPDAEMAATFAYRTWRRPELAWPAPSCASAPTRRWLSGTVMPARQRRRMS
jgi:hypothetical protein